MELQPIAGLQGQGGGLDSDRGRSSGVLEDLTEAARLIAGARQRLEVLVERLAELRRLASESQAGESGGAGAASPR